MSELTTPAPAATAPGPLRAAARWMVTFVGFPLGGLTTALLIGPVDSLVSALLGGLVTGAILGAVQAWGLGRNRPSPVQWIVATAVGLMVGLVAATWVVALSAVWAAGWTITAVAGVQVDQQFAVFGSSGAIVATALTAVLPILVNRSKEASS